MIRYIVILGLCIALFYSCKVAEPQFIETKNLNLVRIDTTTANISLIVKVYNPSNYSYQLQQLDFDIFYKHFDLGNGKLTIPSQINAKDTALLKLDCNLHLNELQKSHRQILEKDTINFTLKGNAFAVHPLKKKNKQFNLIIPVDPKSQFNFKLLKPDLKINKIGLTNINPFNLSNLTKPTFTIVLKLLNRYTFGFNIEALELSLLTENSEKNIVSGVLPKPVYIPANQQVNLPIDVTANNLTIIQHLGKSVFNNSTKQLGKGFVELNIYGHVFKIPINQTFNFSSNPLGYVYKNSI